MNSRQTFRYNNVILDNDVICGRGGASNKHKGNIFFRELVAKHKKNYLASSKAEKKHIAKFIVDTIRRNGGRFLKLDHPMELTDVGDISAMEKTCQALREGLKIRANKKKARNEEKHVPVTFTESSLSSHSQYLPASHYNYSTILSNYNMIASSQNKHNTTHGQINENNPRHNYNINSNRQEYFHAQGIEYSNQNQNLELKFERNKSAQQIGKHTTYGQISVNNPRHNYNINSNRQAYFHAQDIQYRNQNQNLEHNFEYNKSAQHIGKHTAYGQISANNPRHNYNINPNRKGYFHAQNIHYSNQNQNLEHNFEYKKPAQYIGRCTCKKSNCLKLYCQCFANSVYCSPEDCRCTNCYNSVHYSELVHQAEKKREEKCALSQRA